MTAPRLRQCKVCKTPFRPYTTIQQWCSASCGYELAKLNRQKRYRKEKQIFLDNDLKHQKRRLTDICHRYIRARDKDQPCISCGRYHQGQYHAGHYLSRGANPETRWCELNIHKQCAPCNNHHSGNIAKYRANLIKKIGIEAVEWLEGPHELHKWTLEEVKDAIDWYKYKLKALD